MNNKCRAFFLAGILGMGLLLGTSGLAQALTISNAPSGGAVSSFGVPDSQTYGQVFTAPITGTLTSFTLWLNGGVGELFGGVGTWNGTPAWGMGFGSPTNIYQSANVPSLGAGPYTFSPNISVTAGNLYVAYLSVFGVAGANNTVSMPLGDNSDPSINYFVWNNSTDPRGNSSWNYFFNAGDAQFRAEFSAVSAVPEPSTVALLSLGLIGAWAIRNRKTA